MERRSSGEARAQRDSSCACAVEEGVVISGVEAPEKKAQTRVVR